MLWLAGSLKTFGFCVVAGTAMGTTPLHPAQQSLLLCGSALSLCKPEGVRKGAGLHWCKSQCIFFSIMFSNDWSWQRIIIVYKPGWNDALSVHFIFSSCQLDVFTVWGALKKPECLVEVGASELNLGMVIFLVPACGGVRVWDRE